MSKLVLTTTVVALLSVSPNVFAENGLSNPRTFKSFTGSSSGPSYYSNYRNTSRGYQTVNLVPRTVHFPSTITPTGKKVFIYDPKKVGWAAYNAEGKLVKSGPGSAGANYCPDIRSACRTPAGIYTVYNKQGPGYRSKIYPKPNGGAPMPYAMFFKGGYAIHGSYDVPNYNASHGCVRVHPQDARWLSENFIQPGTTVVIRSYNL